MNQASRLQELGKLQCAVRARGMPTEFPGADLLSESLRRECVRVRGADEDIVFVVDAHWMDLSVDEQTSIKSGLA